MNIRKVLSLFLAVTMLLAMTACGAKAGQAEQQGQPEEQAASDGEITVTDMVGRQVQVVPGSYKRVVCIGAGALRMYSYIADVSLLCGVEDIDNINAEGRPKMFDSSARPYVMAYGDVFNTLPSCGVGGPNAQAAEAEKILSCNPDIVISEYEDVDKENALQEQLGVPVITLKSGPSGVFAEEFLGSLTLLGQVFAEDERAAELIAFVQRETDDISARTEGTPESEKPCVYICGLGNWGTTDHLTTSETYSTFRVAHIKNALSGLGMKGIGKIEEEKFISMGEDCDIMFIDGAAVKNIKPLMEDDPGLLDCVRAWRNGDVYLEMAYNSYYTNYEIALANAWFTAKTVYPEAFGDIDITDKLNEITSEFLGRELAGEIYACPASFGGYQRIDTEEF